MFRIAAALIMALGLVACTDATRDLAGPTVPLGDFRMLTAVVLTEKPAPQKLLVSRDATPEEWIETVDKAVKTRFGRFDGANGYYLGIKVIAYSLPPPIVPGKSAVHLAVTVFDSECSKLNPKVHDIMVIQIFETRLELTREEQMTRLAETAAKDIETWLREMQETDGWFTEGYELPAGTQRRAGGCGN